MRSCRLLLSEIAAISLPRIESGLPSLPVLRSEPRSGNYRVRNQGRFCNVVGGVISPLLANVVLNRLDWQLHEAGYRFARYADDFVVLCQNPQQAQEALTLVKQVLENELGLHLSPEK